jgi:hypothetical protein
MENELLILDDEIEATHIVLSKEECEAILNECKHSYISYENPLAREVIARMMRFVYGK